METLDLQLDDSRILWGVRSSQWSETEMTDANGDNVVVMASSSANSMLVVSFRGTGIKLYAGATGETRMEVSLDGGSLTAVSPSTSPGSAPLLERTGLQDTDHQLSLHGRGACWVHHIELQSTTGQGFDPVNYTVNAKAVPPEAVKVEDFSERIEYDGNWEPYDDDIYTGGRLHRTIQVGSSFTYRFEGVAIWMFTDYDQYHTSRVVTLDDGPGETLSTYLPSGHTTQRLAWSRIGLAANLTHTLKVEHQGTGYITLDFFRILRSQDADILTPSASFSGDSTTTRSLVESSPPSDSSKRPSTTVLGVAIAVPIVVIGLAFGVAFFVIERRKNRRNQPVHIIDPLPHSAGQPDSYRIYSPPPGPPPQGNAREEYHQAERPSMEETLPKSLLAVNSGLRSTGSSGKIVLPIESSISTQPSSRTSQSLTDQVGSSKYRI